MSNPYNSLNNSNSLHKENPNGLIFVWDLDQTLIDGPEIKNINENALRIMHEAFVSGKLTANLMLTNNGAEGFITAAQMALLEKYNQMFRDSQRFSLFSITYNANTPGRVPDTSVPENRRTPGHKAKRLEDVKNMLKKMGINETNLAERVFFFDDLDHVIRTQIPPSNYIQITPPFNTVAADITNYEPVLSALRQSGGASKKHTRKNNKKISKSKKYKKHKKLTKRAR